MSATTHPKIHALIVGIDNYPIRRHRLNGCVNDATALKAYLEGNFPCEQLNIEFLTDEAVTRQGIIDGFAHFAAAKDGEVCLFYYSGHGSRVPAPVELLHLEPDGLLESLVCYDSRIPGGRDLLDKELSHLIAEATEGKDVHFVGIFDCCHSGSNTRAAMDDIVTARMAENARTAVALDQVLGFAEAKIALDAGRHWEPRRGRHVHLAAARASETAKELKINGQTRGAFTYSLIEVLQQTGGGLSYQEVVEHLRARIADRVAEQTPQLEAATEYKDKELVFLNQERSPRTMSYAIERHDGDWYLMAGQVHGLPVGKGDAIQVSVREKGQERFSTALSEVGFDKSRLVKGDDLAEATVYRGVITRLPAVKAKVAFLPATEQAVKEKVLAYVAEAPSIFYELVDSSETADYHIESRNGKLLLLLPDGERPLFKRVDWSVDGGVGTFMDGVESVARYRFVRHISNPNTRITDQDFSLTWERIKEPGSWESDDKAEGETIDWRRPQVFRYKYDHANDKWLVPAFRLNIKNTSDRTLYFSAVNLVPQFGINNKFLPGERLDPGEEVSLSEQVQGQTYRTIPVSIHPDYTKAGVAEVTEYFKLYVSTEQVDTTSFNQEDLKIDTERTRAGRESLRSVKSADMQPDWRTIDLTLNIVRPVDEVDIPDGGQKELADQLRIQLPQGVKAKASLTGVAEAERNLSDNGDLPRLPDQVPGWSTHHFGEGFDNAPAAAVLELEIDNPDAINADNPIRLDMLQGLADNELVIPVGYDEATGLLLPLGIMDGENGIVIDELPAPTPNGERSLLGSVKIFFQKTVLSKFGEKYDYPQLAIAEFADAPESLDFTYVKEEATVKERVAAAERVVIFMHGIIGDTTEMPKAAYLAQNADGVLLADHYDLLLTFDYENLNTSIKQTAKDLKKRLEVVGLGADHGKELHIIAHSMGGLVSRWFIEKEGGDKMVQHLFLVGTPNNGSPWSSVYEMSSTFLAQAVNGAAFFKPYLIPLRFVGKFLDKLFLTLKEMKIGSDFLKELNDGTDPGVPYTILAGNTQLIPGPQFEQQVKLLQRILRRFKSRGHYMLLDRVLFKESNDIAVSVESISGIAGADARQSPPKVVVVASDHISYFASPAGLEKLGAAIE